MKYKVYIASDSFGDILKVAEFQHYDYARMFAEAVSVKDPDECIFSFVQNSEADHMIIAFSQNKIVEIPRYSSLADIEKIEF